MHLTVEEALRIYPLSKARIAAGIEGKGRIIRSVNTMDAPDVTDWVKTGEMLFTTAFAIRDTPEDFLRILQRLNDRGAAGLGIKLGRYWTEIPPVVIEEANRLNFPLLELPFEFTFSDQMNALMQAEIEKSTKKLHDALDKQKNLMRFAMQPGDSSQHFQQIGDILAHPIVVISARGQILYNTSDWPETELLLNWPWIPKYQKLRSASGWRCTIPLMEEGECYGFLMVMPRHASAIQEEEGLFHQAAEILSFHMDRFQDERQSVSAYRWTSILERYLLGRMLPEAFLEQSRAVLGDSAQAAVFLCVMTCSEQDDGDGPNRGLRKIRRDLMYHPYLSKVSSHHLFMAERMVSIFTLTESGMSVSAHQQGIVASFSEVLESGSNEGFRCFVSNPKFELEELLEAYGECEKAQDISNRLSFERTVTLFSDLELNYIFRHIPQDTMQQYCNNLLKPLSHKGEDYTSEILRTLEVYFANEGHVNEVARQLFVHRNTVLYRLEKAGELLGVDLKKISDLLQLKLALVFRRMISIENNKRSE
ncbi:PucR family transcriptional regulator [Paenibacillus oenotherae]|uniref:PucR family transcriptional regulator n=1 Tax=Paenibacillus oenotherae TaxID=1435645 RepID=A0ABS7D7B0_9BACL|nr:PucR family transcriptional regulator [Paenibacillus oenotherae]MBW7475832.1 PucR family transcriptional regulator [Paenibacillus oenotherae]